MDMSKSSNILVHTTADAESLGGGKFELSPITVNSDYLKKFNSTHYGSFICLTRDGVLVRETLYRKGGFGGKMNDGYIMLLKYVEAYYDDLITKKKDEKPHLEGRWCILDENGVEKVECKQFANPYHTGGIVYSLDSNYYNIETGELYCRSYSCMTSNDFIFLDNAYDKDTSKRGIMKINKLDGSFELFPSK